MSAAEVLAAHALYVDSKIADVVGCSCGWKPVTPLVIDLSGWEQFTQHQSEMLAAAGLLVTAEHDREVAAGAWDEVARVAIRCGARYFENPYRIARGEADRG